jgi:hypothetical protein
MDQGAALFPSERDSRRSPLLLTTAVRKWTVEAKIEQKNRTLRRDQ